MISGDIIVSKKEKTPWRMIEEEAVIVDVDNGNVVQLNEVGSEVWTLIDGRKSVSEIVLHICECFEVDKKRAFDDVSYFLEQIYRRGLIGI
jgi:hypothetical protein